MKCTCGKWKSIAAPRKPWSRKTSISCEISLTRNASRFKSRWSKSSKISLLDIRKLSNHASNRWMSPTTFTKFVVLSRILIISWWNFNNPLLGKPKTFPTLFANYLERMSTPLSKSEGAPTRSQRWPITCLFTPSKKASNRFATKFQINSGPTWDPSSTFRNQNDRFHLSNMFHEIFTSNTRFLRKISNPPECNRIHHHLR